MTIKAKALKVLSWALGAILVSSIAWAAVGWKVDGYGNIKSGRSSVILAPGQTSNCRLTYSGSTLSIVGADGNALSASNPCVVQLNAATTLSFTSPVSSTFGAASDTDGNVFGVTAGVAWGSDLPFQVVACQGSASNYFGFSRIPTREITGSAAAGMAQEGDTDGDGQADLFIMTSGLTLANEVNMPCVNVATFHATMDASNQWTVTALSTADGFGWDRINKTWAQTYVLPTGQKGAKANYHYNAPSNKTPTYATPANVTAYWRASLNNECIYWYSTRNAGNCTQNGTPAGEDVLFSLPYDMASGAPYPPSSSPALGWGGAQINNVQSVAYLRAAAGASTAQVVYSNNAASWNTMADDEWCDNAVDDIDFAAQYKFYP